MIPSKSVSNDLPSRFLAPGFDPGGKIALLAGRGRYPELVAEAVRQLDLPFCLIGFDGETGQDLIDSFPAKERAIVKVGQIGKMLKELGRLGVTQALMAGQIAPKRLFSGLHPDLRAVKILASLKERNAETIFGAVVREMEGVGVTLLDARSFLDAHIAEPGMMTRSRKPLAPEVLEHGIRVAKEIARLDIGQGIVVRKGTVLIVEGFDGTDAMLRRAGEFKTDGKLFIKTVKPNQDYRFDVPVFGLHTLDRMLEANIDSVALEAGNTVVLDKPEVIAKANKHGIRIFGYETTVGEA